MSHESDKKQQTGKKQRQDFFVGTTVVGHGTDGGPAEMVSGSLPGHTNDGWPETGTVRS